jgi:hypothetical protein
MNEYEQELKLGADLARKYPEYAKACRAEMEASGDWENTDSEELLAKVPNPPREMNAFRVCALSSYLCDLIIRGPKKTTADPEAKAKAERKKHKLGDEVPTPLALYAPAEWRRYPGMPDILIHRDQIAVVQRVSRRRGVYFKTLPRRSFQKKDFWRHFKDGKRTLISVKRAMYECGFWQRKTK